jgi:hypothetical protein
MTLPLGQEFRIVDGPSPFNCDITTIPIDGRHIETSVGGAGQSTISWEAAEAIYELVKSTKTRIAREPKLRVEAVA